MVTSLAKPLSTKATLGNGSEVMVKFGVVGYGYWGPNVVRNLDRMDEAEVVAVCDKSAAARKKVAKAYPGVLVT
ncbi:MAG: Gfo/Idh/MocA family oxidoreductase, partial [Candidatus Sulfotelmatobacter sp.]